MKKTMRTVLSVTVASAMILSMASCSLFDKAKEQILEAADSYAGNLAKASISKIIKATNDDIEADADMWTEVLTFSAGDLYDADQAAAMQAITDTITYEIDEKSVEGSTKDGEGSVDVVFTIADWESVVADEAAMTDVDSFIAAINAADTTEMTITIEFELDDDEWLVSNYNKIFSKLYAYVDADISFVPPLVDMVDYTQWWFDDSSTDGQYTNTDVIDLDIYFLDGADYSAIYYTIVYNGELIFTSQPGLREGYFYATDPGATTDETGEFLAAGSYDIIFYDGQDNELARGTATVLVEEVNVEDVTFTWWFDEGDGVYSNTDMIDLDLNLAPGMSSTDVYYTVSYNGQLIYTSPDGNRMGYFYNSYEGAPTTANGNLAAGSYDIQFFLLDGTPLGGDVATVYNDEGGEQPGGGGSETGDYRDYVGENFYETGTGDPFYDGTSAPSWWDVNDLASDEDDSRNESARYASGVAAIQLAFQSQDDTLGDVEYVYYLIPDPTTLDGAQEVYRNTIGYTEYAGSDGSTLYWYNCTYTGSIADGLYLVELYHNGTLQSESFCIVGNA